jgi:hypothetical protein
MVLSMLWHAGRLREAKTELTAAIEIFKLNLLAYPDSADACGNLADAYLKGGQSSGATPCGKGGWRSSILIPSLRQVQDRRGGRLGMLGFGGLVGESRSI